MIKEDQQEAKTIKLHFSLWETFTEQMSQTIHT